MRMSTLPPKGVVTHETQTVGDTSPRSIGLWDFDCKTRSIVIVLYVMVKSAHPQMPSG